MRIFTNSNFKRLENNYLFAEISRKVGAFSAKHPDMDVISLGIGDVTEPLARAVTREMQLAVAEMTEQTSFKGYPPAFGYDFLRRAVANYYCERGINVSAYEVYISDGAKSDIADIGDILGANEVLIPTPVYPAYLDSAIISGRRVRFIDASENNGFLPTPDALPKKPFVIHLCSPNNPTGAVFSYEMLRDWVDFALKSGSLILFDAAYEAFVRDNSLPRSIFEIEGARECAIEIGSFSKMAGFTGVRCGWMLIPEELRASDGTKLCELWKRRQTTRRNGVSYITQRGAGAALSREGLRENGEKIERYMENAHILSRCLSECGVRFWGGENAPYLWLKCPSGTTSWELFDCLLSRAAIVGTPGVGFGAAGEGYFRFTAFATHEDTERAADRLRDVFVGDFSSAR